MDSVQGRIIRAGVAEGPVLLSEQPIGFLGGVDPDTGIVIEAGHPLEGCSVRGQILAFPTGKGSTVGSYTLYRLARNGMAPAGILCAQSEPIVAVGAIISEIPMLDQIDLSLLHAGDWLRIEGDTLTIWPQEEHPHQEAPACAS